MSDSLPLHELHHAMLLHSLPSPRVCSHSYPVYLDSYIPFSYAILFFTASVFTFITRHIHSRASFLLWPSHFLLSGAVSNCLLLFPSSILDIFWPGEWGVRDGVDMCVIFQCYIFLLFSTVHGVLQATVQAGAGCHFLLQWTRIFQNSSLWPIHLGWLCMAWLIAALL